jgi:hypothetical protein
VARDPYNQTVIYQPEAEGPARVAKAFYKLANGLTIVRGKKEIGEAEYDLLFKIGMDSIPVQRKRILDHLSEFNDLKKPKEVAKYLEMPTMTVRLILEDVTLLGMAEQCADTREGEEIADNTPWRYRMKDEIRELYNSISPVGFEVSVHEK